MIVDPKLGGGLPITPLVSIITVVLNRKETILRAIESVENQNYLNIEHIVIDGNSTDGTIEIIKSRRSVKQFICEPDCGIYDAINKGIKVSNGKIIALLHSDDLYFDKNVVGDAVHFIMERGCGGVYGDVFFFNGKNTDKYTRIYSSERFKPKYLRMGLMPAHPTLFLKKEIYEEYGLYNNDYKIAGDFEFITRIFKKQKINLEYNSQIKVKMQHGGLSTSGVRNFIKKEIELIRACKENGIKTNPFILASRVCFKFKEFLL